jgi:hypothetical protein
MTTNDDETHTRTITSFPLTIQETKHTLITTDSSQHVLTLGDLARHNRVLKQSCDDSTDAMNGSDDFDDYQDDHTDAVVESTDRWNLLTMNNAKFSSTMGISGDDEDYETLNRVTLPATTAEDDSVQKSLFQGFYTKSTGSEDDTLDAGDTKTTSSSCGRTGMTTSQVDSTRAFADYDSDYQL